jgi:hypothetical protein
MDHTGCHQYSCHGATLEDTDVLSGVNALLVKCPEKEKKRKQSPPPRLPIPPHRGEHDRAGAAALAGAQRGGEHARVDPHHAPVARAGGERAAVAAPRHAPRRCPRRVEPSTRSKRNVTGCGGLTVCKLVFNSCWSPGGAFSGRAHTPSSPLCPHQSDGSHARRPTARSVCIQQAHAAVPARRRDEPGGGGRERRLPAAAPAPAARRRRVDARRQAADARVPQCTGTSCEFESKGLKPGFHFIGSRVETRRLSSYGST